VHAGTQDGSGATEQRWAGGVALTTACYANLKHHPNLQLVQGDIFGLPFFRGEFLFVYLLGVLQQTPNVEKVFAALPPMTEDSGKLCVDY